MKRRLAAIGLAALAFVSGGCGDGGGGSAPAAPAPPPPAPPPPFGAAFAETELEVLEGDTLEIGIRYEVRELPSEAVLRIRAASGEASEDEYRLSSASVSIPAGQGLSGTASLAFEALPDLLFAEGRETVSLEFDAAGAAASATLGDPLRVAILEAGVSPCTGVRLRALPWEEEKPRAAEFPPPMLATTLELDLAGGALDTWLELVGPYYNLFDSGNQPRSITTLGITGWRVGPAGTGLRHELAVNWPGESWFEDEEEARLAFRLLGPTCPEEPVASCSSESCEIVP